MASDMSDGSVFGLDDESDGFVPEVVRSSYVTLKTNQPLLLVTPRLEWATSDDLVMCFNSHVFLPDIHHTCARA